MNIILWSIRKANSILFNTRLTGISGKTVRNAPVFLEIWKQIEPNDV